MTLTFTIVGIVLLATGFVYVRQILSFFAGLSKLQPGTNDQLLTVTVLVPARNEEDHIEACIHSLLQQDYPSDKYRVIVIDDQSEDKTAEIVRQLAQQKPDKITLLSVAERPEDVSPKINALRHGIKQSEGELIFTTDADCVAPPEWISSLVRYFEGHVGVVTGTTLLRNNNNTSPRLFGIQFLDFVSHTACAAGAIGNGKVNNCNGSNMAFRRSVYEDVGGYDSLAHLNSGDDSLLAQKIVATGAWEVRFCLDQTSFVATAPAASWRAFLQQRMRWAAQTADYRFDTLVFLISTFIYYLALIVVLLGSLANVQYLVLFVLAFIPKLWVDYRIVKRFTNSTGTEQLMRFYPLAALTHIPTIVFAVVGGFFGRFDWKGRKTARTTA